MFVFVNQFALPKLGNLSGVTRRSTGISRPRFLDSSIPRRDGLIHFIEIGGNPPHRFEVPEQNDLIGSFGLSVDGLPQ